jgi:lipoprotein-anchoring transpeptidase ErfK/SrfK
MRRSDDAKGRARPARRRARAGASIGAAFLLVATVLFVERTQASAAGALPPWTDRDDVPLPPWARAVEITKGDAALLLGPGRNEARRGTATLGARLPLFGAKRGPGCAGRWLLVGPLAWTCSDGVELRAEAQAFDPGPPRGIGLPYSYFFAGREGAMVYVDPARADDAPPDRELEPGFAIAVTSLESRRGERWARTRRGEWVRLRELYPANPSAFRGEQVAGGALDFAWVLVDSAGVFGAPDPRSKRVATRVRFERVGYFEERATRSGTMVRVSPDGEEPASWMAARDLAHPSAAPPPRELEGVARGERWIDVELASQTLVAYEGERPVFATLVSTGAGKRGSDTATPPGVHRIWVKLATSTMSNLDREDQGRHYAIEDVPYVQFFDGAVALHGAFWHRDFGRPRSHGCVNLAPFDAEWLFAFTGPKLPAGWTAALPTRLDKGTAVRVR